MRRTTTETIPRYFQPWPHQQRAWARQASGKYTYYFKLWARQIGKDVFDLQYNLKRAWDNPGTQSVYVGLDNGWINNNIFKKYIDGRTFWAEYPDQYIDVKDTQKEVLFKNNPRSKAPARVKFIGFLNDQALIGSSYDNFTVSETSLYPANAFQYMRPIWDRKLGRGEPLSVSFNGTPRGVRNVMYDLLRVYTGVDEVDEFPGEHGNCYVDKVTINDAMVPDGEGGFRKLYSPAELEVLKHNYLREFGNLNFFAQENECDFTVVNAGLVYLGIEYLMSEKRYTQYKPDATKPMYIAFDIAAGSSDSDATAAVIYQCYNGKMFVYDIYEDWQKTLTEAMSEIMARDYSHMIRMAFVPWDAGKRLTKESPADEARVMFPSITWHQLERETVKLGISKVRQQMPNMIINSDHCERLLDALMAYEYKRLEKADDWSARPKKSWAWHLCDALRYAVMGIEESNYLRLNAEGTIEWPDEYQGFEKEEADDKYPLTWKKRRKEREDALRYR